MVLGGTYARFRVSTAGTDSSTGLALDGEVEDYFVNTVQFDDPPTLSVPTSPLSFAEDSEAAFLLNGVTTGGEDELIRLSAVSSNPELFSVTGFELSANGNQAQLGLSSVPNTAGAGTVVVTIQSSGPDQLFDTSDDQVIRSTIAVNVTPVNDAPTGYANTLFLALPENAGLQSVQLTDVSAGPMETSAVTLRVTTDKPEMFKTLRITNNVEDATRASLELETSTNQRGNALVFVTIDDGTLTTTQTITLQVTERNDPPAFTAPDTVMLDSGTISHSLNLTGISAGAGETQLVQHLVSTSGTPGEIAVTPSVTYQSGSTTGTLNVTFPPNSSGNVTVLVIAQDAGADGIFGNADDATTTHPILFALNSEPTVDTLASRGVLLSAGTQTVSLSGISDGDSAQTQPLRITATSSNNSTLDNLSVDYDADNAGTTAQLRFTPIALGSSIVSVNVTDAGYDGQFDTADDRTKTRQFTINVAESLSGWHNSANPLDVNGDGLVVALDVLLIVNELNAQGNGPLPTRTTSEPPYLDVNNDGQLQPLDALMIINEINRRLNGEGELPAQLSEVQQNLNRAVDEVHSAPALDGIYDEYLPFDFLADLADRQSDRKLKDRK